MVLSDIRDAFPINMSGVEDIVENYQSYLDACCAVIVFESYEIHFISFCHSFLDFSHNIHARICFRSLFFTAHTSLACKKCLTGMQFDCKPDKMMSRTLYKTRVAANVILKIREMDAMNDTLYLRLYQIIEREPAS